MSPASLSRNPRYQLLSDQILAARGEDIVIDIGGAERLRDDRRLDRARGRLHQHPAARPGQPGRLPGVLERLPGDRRRPARASARTRRTCSARSCGARPGSRCSSRPPTPAARSSRRRACGRGCGSASAGSPRSSTCSRRTSATSRRCSRSSTTRTRSRCSRPAATPALHELRLHNGTIYRWNRPVYDVVDGVPHLRVENRVLPAGPTVVDTMANAAFYFGLVRALAEARAAAVVADVVHAPPRRTSTSAARQGIDAQVYWPGVGQVPATELVLRRLLPLAHAGPRGLGRRPTTRRPGCSASSSSAACPARNGASWFVEPVHAEGAGAGPAGGAAADAAGLPRARCTPTSPCTPGTPEPGRQREPDPQPVPDHRLVEDRVEPAVLGDHRDAAGRQPGLGEGPAHRRQPGQVDVVRPRCPDPGQPGLRVGTPPPGPGSRGPRRSRPAARGRGRPRRRTSPRARPGRRRAAPARTAGAGCPSAAHAPRPAGRRRSRRRSPHRPRAAHAPTLPDVRRGRGAPPQPRLRRTTGVGQDGRMAHPHHRRRPRRPGPDRRPVRPAARHAARPAVPDGARVPRPGEGAGPVRHPRPGPDRRRRPRGVRRAVRRPPGGAPVPGSMADPDPGAGHRSSSRSTTATPTRLWTEATDGKDLLRRIQRCPASASRRRRSSSRCWPSSSAYARTAGRRRPATTPRRATGRWPTSSTPRRCRRCATTRRRRRPRPRRLPRGRDLDRQGCVAE